MTPTSSEEIIFLLPGLVLLWFGIRGMFTGKIKVRSGRKNRWSEDPAYEYELDSGGVIYLGFCLTLWGAFICLFGIQGLQKVNPNMLDALNTIIKRFVKTSDNHIFVVLLGISFLLIAITIFLTQYFGESRELD